MHGEKVSGRVGRCSFPYVYFQYLIGRYDCFVRRRCHLTALSELYLRRTLCRVRSCRRGGFRERQSHTSDASHRSLVFLQRDAAVISDRLLLSILLGTADCNWTRCGIAVRIAQSHLMTAVPYGRVITHVAMHASVIRFLFLNITITTYSYGFGAMQ